MAFWKGENFCFELGLRTYIIGVLNVTPDSFSDGGLWNDSKKAVAHAVEMQNEGADIIDIGAQSTRPGSEKLSAQEEIERLAPIWSEILKNVTVPISIDTYYPQVAEFALKNGASIINDVSGRFNADMANVVKQYNAGWIVMHTGGGTPLEPAIYDNGVVSDVKDFFEVMKQRVSAFGIDVQQLCFDAGIGFGKSNEDNLNLIRDLAKVKPNSVALLTALSRKRVIGNATGEQQAQNRLYGTIAANTVAIAGKTDFIRVHDVAQCLQAAKMADAIYRGSI
ncbi:MAG: dihydropteroate synthase [Clostridia bacterium]|nr:dihydropteroate synthase [Clostridia bacterium]